MKRITLTCLLVLLPIIDCSTASGDSKIAFDQPSLWYGNAGGSGDAGPLPALSSDKWRLLLSEQGLHYVERSGSQSSELLSIPYEKIAAVRADPSERAYPTLVVDLTDHSEGKPLSHVFLIMHPGSPDARSAAMEAKILIEDLKQRGPASVAQAAPMALEESLPKEPRIPRSVGEDRIAISAAEWQPAVEVREAVRPESQRAGRVRRWAANGAKGPATLTQGCAQAGCHPVLLVSFLGVTALAAAGGAVAALGADLVQSGVEAATRPGAWSAEAAQAAVSTIRTAAGDSISQSALQQCVLRRLTPEGGEAAPIRWSDGQRAASFSRFGGTGSIARDQLDTYARVPRDDHRYVIETFLSRVLLVPEGRPGRDASDPLLRIVVEGGFRMFDLNGGDPREQTSEWRAEHRTLSAWNADGGAALNEALSIACDGLAARILTEAEDLWRIHKESVAAVSRSTNEKDGNGEN